MAMKRFLRFFVPSALGVFFFLTPVDFGGKVTIPMGVLSDGLRALVGGGMVWVVAGILLISAVVTPLVSWTRLPLLREGHFLRPVFDVGNVWVWLRISGAACALLILTQSGPEFVWSERTGHIVLYDLATAIVTIFLFAGFLLPLLTDYGFMELVGTIAQPAFRKIFRLPGRSAIDATASWLAAAAVGILITSQQYERGFYTKREAAVIATNFSVVSLPFCLLVVEFMGIGQYFVPYYLTIVGIGLISAIIVPRLPPLSKIPDQYHPNAGEQPVEEASADLSVFRRGLNRAVERAVAAPDIRGLARSAALNVSDIWFGLIPAVITIGLTGLVIVEFTPIMTWLSYPLVPVLELLRLPEAAAAAPAMLVGFADMFLPAVIGKDVESEVTRLAIAIVSISQLIYMSEVGALLLKCPIPLRFPNLVAIFLIRTAIALPIAAGAAHIIV